MMVSILQRRWVGDRKCYVLGREGRPRLRGELRQREEFEDYLRVGEEFTIFSFL